MVNGTPAARSTREDYQVTLTRRQFSSIAGVAINLLHAQDLRMVKARRKPNDEWHEYPTRTLDRVAGFRPVAKAPKTDTYGGRLDRVPFHRSLRMRPGLFANAGLLHSPRNPY